MVKSDLQIVNQWVEQASAQEVLTWAWDRFPSSIFATSSFQSQSVPLLHLISQVVPQLPVIYLDTGFHFPETLAFRDQLIREWGLNVLIVNSDQVTEGAMFNHGHLYRKNPDLCCFMNKVEPLQQVIANNSAWISGIRRDQTSERRNIPIIDVRDVGIYKISPIAKWTRDDVWRYINDNELPIHPLYSKGYVSIGCAPCTRPIAYNEDDRAGRWADQEKTECGLHTPVNI
jgi:phosphoadenosine phosphosulfate reductase